jgi:hypothetical protein
MATPRYDREQRAGQNVLHSKVRVARIPKVGKCRNMIRKDRGDSHLADKDGSRVAAANSQHVHPSAVGQPGQA